MTVPAPRLPARIPTRPIRLFKTNEKKLDHIASLPGAIGRGSMPQVVVDNTDRPGLPRERDCPLLIPLVEVVAIVTARDNASGAALGRRVLRIVKGHGPAQPMMSPAPAILVQPLPLRPRLVEMTEPMRMQIVPRPQNTGQGPCHLGVCQTPAANRGMRGNRLLPGLPSAAKTSSICP